MSNPRSLWRGLITAACLAFAVSAPAWAQDAGTDGLVEGRDYTIIPDGEPWEPLDGKVEVVEVFSYGCIHCFRFQPLVDAWRAKAPADVRFTYLPAVYFAGDNLARGFFAAQSIGIEASSHHALFSAVQQTSTVPRSGATVDAMADFYAEHGAPSRSRFAALMTSPEIDEKMNAAHAFAVRSGVQGTPTLIINGRYLVMGRRFEDLLRVTDQLIARERVGQ